MFHPSTIVRRIALGVALLALVSSGNADKREPAPNFHAKTMTGENFTNASVKGKVVLLEFWTTWCPVCKSEEKLVDDIDKELAPKGLLVLAVDVGESKKTVKKYLERNPRAVRIVLNDDTNLAAMYAANAYPIYVVLDRNGNIAAEQRGGGGERALRNIIAQGGIGRDPYTIYDDD